MTIEEKLVDIWEADAAAIALVPAARFKVPGNWQDLARPYVIMYPIAEEATRVHNSSAAVTSLRIWDFFQFDVVADSFSSAKAVAEKLRSVFNGNTDGVQFFYRGQRWLGVDDPQGVGKMSVDFRIVENL